MFARHNAGAALSAKAVPKPIKEFQEEKAVCFFTSYLFLNILAFIIGEFRQEEYQ